MADTLRRLLGWGKRASLPSTVEDTASSSGDQEQGEEVLIQQYGSLRGSLVLASSVATFSDRYKDCEAHSCNLYTL